GLNSDMSCLIPGASRFSAGVSTPCCPALAMASGRLLYYPRPDGPRGAGTTHEIRAQGRDLMAHVPLHPLWSSLALDRLSGVSLQDQIANFFREGIVAGRIQRGRRVPSTRQLAVEHGVSRTTAEIGRAHV